ncbi:MAG: YidC/Oxa1 family membrane protein insertase [Clostridia bacterium]|nr:YidC/Oxa1 family membrane protein insertase [Clostridia bacterium]
MNDFLFGILQWINSWVGSYGWAMVVFTVLIRLVLTPLDVKSRVSMRKTAKLQPQMAALQKKYANDKEKLNQKTAELYRKEHINPLSSCLPLLLTWPILIAVFGAMRTAANQELLVQVGQLLNLEAPTLERWLWIKNLWMPDSLFSPAYPDLGTLNQIGADQWLAWFKGLDQAHLPALLQGLNLTEASFAGDQIRNTITAIQGALQNGNAAYAEALSVAPGMSVNLLVTQLNFVRDYNGLMILPILSAVSQIAMTKLTGQNQNQNGAAGSDPAASTGKFMMWFFPIFSLVLCFSYSSAFALYWVAGNLVSMVQTLAINRYLDSKEAKTAAVAGEGTVK